MPSHRSNTPCGSSLPCRHLPVGIPELHGLGKGNHPEVMPERPDPPSTAGLVGQVCTPAPNPLNWLTPSWLSNPPRLSSTLVLCAKKSCSVCNAWPRCFRALAPSGLVPERSLMILFFRLTRRCEALAKSSSSKWYSECV